jgi:hypothetical protein
MNAKIITEDALSNLPEPVQKYMHYTGVVGHPWIQSARLKQFGKFRQGVDRPWMDFSAEEFYTTDPPGFRWNAKFKRMGIPLLRVEDKYENGHGSMLGKLAGLKTIFDARGKELDQGSMMRYLNEVMWFPTAYLGDNMRWEAVDDKSAKVKFSDGGREIEASLYFDKEGRLENFIAKRYREIEGEYSLDTWSTPITAYGEFARLKFPIRGSAIWHLPEGDLSYIVLKIKDIEYNWKS